jgi:hypothetical protein
MSLIIIAFISVEINKLMMRKKVVNCKVSMILSFEISPLLPRYNVKKSAC